MDWIIAVECETRLQANSFAEAFAEEFNHGYDMDLSLPKVYFRDLSEYQLEWIKNHTKKS